MADAKSSPTAAAVRKTENRLDAPLSKAMHQLLAKEHAHAIEAEAFSTVTTLTQKGKLTILKISTYLSNPSTPKATRQADMDKENMESTRAATTDAAAPPRPAPARATEAWQQPKRVAGKGAADAARFPRRFVVQEPAKEEKPAVPPVPAQRKPPPPPPANRVPQKPPTDKNALSATSGGSTAPGKRAAATAAAPPKAGPRAKSSTEAVDLRMKDAPPPTQPPQDWQLDRDAIGPRTLAEMLSRASQGVYYIGLISDPSVRKLLSPARPEVPRHRSKTEFEVELTRIWEKLGTPGYDVISFEEYGDALPRAGYKYCARNGPQF